MRLLNSAEMKQVEQFTAKYGLSYQRMMENAGSACTRNIRNIIEKGTTRRRNVVVVCGKGNNGGDGFVIARKFAENGYNVCAVLACGYPTSQEAIYMYKMMVDLSIPTVWYEADRLKAIQTVKCADVIVDAIFGFSFYGNLSPEIADLIDEMSNADGIKFAVDVPSGVYCDSGFMDEHCFKSDYTIAISALKPAHIIHPAADCCGDIIIANIGIPEDSYKLINNSMYTFSKTEVSYHLPKRSSTANKGDFGHVLSVCGSRNMPGAPVLAASAALRSGAGLVTAAFPESIYTPMALKLTEALLMPLQENSQGTLSADCLETLLPALSKYSAVLVGCGLGVNDDTREIVRQLIRYVKVPLIIDADGINIIASDIDMLKEAAGPVILTPHPKEMSRLTGIPTEMIQADRIKIAGNFANTYNVTLVLKGANTVVAVGGENDVYVNSSGNCGLAKGGSGDALAGIIASLAAQGLKLKDAAAVGVYIHGHSADTVAEKHSKTGMLPSDVIENLKDVFADFE